MEYNCVSDYLKLTQDGEIVTSKILYITWSRRIKRDSFNESHLNQLLSRFGTVERIILGEGSRRTAVCIFEKESEAIAAKESLGEVPCDLISGRSLHIEFAVDRVEHQKLCNLMRVSNVISSQVDCNVSALVPGLLMLKDFVSAKEEEELIGVLDSSKHKWVETVKSRQVQHFGYEFNYKTRRCDPAEPLPPMPIILEELTKKIPQDIMEQPDQITANEYLPGQGIAAHIDTHSAFTNAIASLSLGGQTVMEFRHPNGASQNIILLPRSLLVMTGASRYQWTHCIASRSFDIIDGIQVQRSRRISITFRKVQPDDTSCDCQFREQCDSQEEKPSPDTESLCPTLMEQEHVHKFYETAAQHFSSTRYAPWPKVASFIKSLPKGSLIADIGCGNGKYMNCIDSTSYIVGCDRSTGLINICKERKLNAFVGDALKVPLRSGLFDAAISIAVLHHLSTYYHRVHAIKEVLRVLRVGGTGLVYAWAQEQKEGSRVPIDENQQDIFVPWKLDARFIKNKESPLQLSQNEEHSVLQRYCHMYQEGELDRLVLACENAVVEESYFDESNWCVRIRKLF